MFHGFGSLSQLYLGSLCEPMFAKPFVMEGMCRCCPGNISGPQHKTQGELTEGCWKANMDVINVGGNDKNHICQEKTQPRVLLRG